MVDSALIQQCADPTLRPAIVEQFIERAGSEDPLTVTVRSGNRVVLVPKATNSEEALALIRDNLGRNTVRVGITQYPAGLGILEAGALKPDLVDSCANIRMGTALFGKVYRVVAKWYGNPTNKDVLPQVFDDAIVAWQTGYFEGVAVFRTQDSGAERLNETGTVGRDPADAKTDISENKVKPEESAEAVASDANKAGIRVDLSGIGGRP
jgi:hypothetical protein